MSTGLTRRERDHYFRSLKRSSDPWQQGGNSKRSPHRRLQQDHYFRSLRGGPVSLRSLRSDSPDRVNYYFRSLRDGRPLRVDHYFRSLRASDAGGSVKEGEPGQKRNSKEKNHYFRTIRSLGMADERLDMSRFFRRALPQDWNHYFRSMRKRAPSYYSGLQTAQTRYFRPMRQVPSNTNHYFRSLKRKKRSAGNEDEDKDGDGDDLKRSLRTPALQVDHYFRSLRAASQRLRRNHYFRPQQTDHYFRSLRGGRGRGRGDLGFVSQADHYFRSIRAATRGRFFRSMKPCPSQMNHYFRAVKRADPWPEDDVEEGGGGGGDGGDADPVIGQRSDASSSFAPQRIGDVSLHWPLTQSQRRTLDFVKDTAVPEQGRQDLWRSLQTRP